MGKKIFFLLILVISSFEVINAQDWTKEDSLWLVNVLEGKIELKINEESKRAIEDGLLFIPSWIKTDEGDVNIIDMIKHFDVEIPDSVKFRISNIHHLPPGVLSLYVLYMDKLDSLYFNSSMVLTKEDLIEINLMMPKGIWGRASYDEPPRIGVFITTDFNHSLSMAFSPHYRRLVKNKRNAEIYKGRLSPLEQPIRMSQRERDQINQSVSSIKISPIRINPFGNKRNGIDN